MSRLEKHAKKTKDEIHQYPWKVDYELFALFNKHCERLNLSINEALTILVKEEVEQFRNELTDEALTEIVQEFRKRKQSSSALPPAKS